MAVGVIDVLPTCLSSKYFFYTPALKHLSLGKVSAFREMEWIDRERRRCPSLRWYYLGYYIHTCPKMRYKAEYAPSELRCPVTKKWLPVSSDIASRLDRGEVALMTDTPACIAGDGDGDGNGDGDGDATPAREAGDIADVADMKLGVSDRHAFLGVVSFGALSADPGVSRALLRSTATRLRAWRAACGGGGGIEHVADRMVYALQVSDARRAK